MPLGEGTELGLTPSRACGPTSSFWAGTARISTSLRTASASPCSRGRRRRRANKATSTWRSYSTSRTRCAGGFRSG